VAIFGERPSSSVLTYDEPVNEYEYRLNGMPLGNGRLGCMLTGGAARELVLLNHADLRRANLAEGTGVARKSLSDVRRLGNAGRWEEADQLLGAMVADVGCSRELNTYVPAGDLTILMRLPVYAKRYVRTLDLTKGLAKIEFICGDVRFRRTTFVSAVDDAIITRIESDEPGAVTFVAGLGRQPVEQCTLLAKAADGVLEMAGQYERDIGFVVTTEIRDTSATSSGPERCCSTYRSMIASW